MSQLLNSEPSEIPCGRLEHVTASDKHSPAPSIVNPHAIGLDDTSELQEH